MITSDQLTQLKFPIGPFKTQEKISRNELDEFIKTIEAAPVKYRTATEGLSESDLKNTYREGAWNVKHHLEHIKIALGSTPHQKNPEDR